MISPKDKKKNIFFDSITDTTYHWKELLHNPLILFKNRNVDTEKNISTCIELKKTHIKNSNQITEFKETNVYLDKCNSKLSFLKGIFYYNNLLLLPFFFTLFISLIIGIAFEKLNRLDMPQISSKLDVSEIIQRKININEEISFFQYNLLFIGLIFLGIFIAGFYRSRADIKNNNLEKIKNINNIQVLVDRNKDIEKEYSQSFSLLSPTYSSYDWISSLQDIYRIENNENLNFFTYKTISESYRNPPLLTGNIVSDKDFFYNMSTLDYQKNLSENIIRMLNDKMECNLGDSLTQ